MRSSRAGFAVSVVALLILEGRASAANVPGIFELGPKLVGSNVVGQSQQGTSVALSANGSTAMVGGFFDDGTRGAAWVFTRIDGIWTEQQKLVGTSSSADARQGTSVAISADGNTVLVGGPADGGGIGATWVFTRTNGVWTQQGAKLVGTGASGNGAQGASVALSADGNTALIGGYSDGAGVGAAWVFTRTSGTWTQQGGKLVGTGATGLAYQGISVALSADAGTALVGGYGDDATAGAAWVFTRTGNTWSQQGGKLVGTGAVGKAQQGISVALSADGATALLGGFADDSLAGAAWVFTRADGAWTQQGGKLVGNGALSKAQQALSVALAGNGDTALVGGPQDLGSGAAWVFTRTAGVWSQHGAKIVGTGAVLNAQQGRSVALSSDGGTGLVGGFFDDSSIGAAWVLDRIVTKGDVNGDGTVNVNDVFFLINFLFAGGAVPR
jgi:hypothetical protein